MQRLTFSENVLGNKIETITFINIQGFENVTYKFPKQGIIRIKADNETGKSILVKTLKAMVLGEFTDRSIRESLIRDGTQKSLIAIHQYNGNEIGLILNLDGLSYYYLKKKGDNDYTYLPAHVVPDEVVKALGFYIDLEREFCINIRETEPLALIHTDDRTTSSVLNCALNSEELNSAIQFIKDVRKDFSDTYEEILATEASYVALNKSIQIYDEDTLYNQELYLTKTISLLETLEAISTSYNNIGSSLYKLSKTKVKEINKDTLKDIDNLDLHNKLLDKLADIQDNLYHLETTKTRLKSTEKLNKLSTLLTNLNNIEPIYSKYTSLNSVIQDMQTTHNTRNNMDIPILEININLLGKYTSLSNQLDTSRSILQKLDHTRTTLTQTNLAKTNDNISILDSIIQYTESINKVSSTLNKLNDISNLIKDTKVIKAISSSIDYLDTNYKILSTLNHMQILLDSLKTNQTRLLDIVFEIEDITSIIKICPVCGNSLRECGSHE